MRLSNNLNQFRVKQAGIADYLKSMLAGAAVGGGGAGIYGGYTGRIDERDLIEQELADLHRGNEENISSINRNNRVIDRFVELIDQSQQNIDRLKTHPAYIGNLDALGSARVGVDHRAHPRIQEMMAKERARVRAIAEVYEDKIEGFEQDKAFHEANLASHQEAGQLLEDRGADIAEQQQQIKKDTDKRVRSGTLASALRHGAGGAVLGGGAGLAYQGLKDLLFRG